MLQATTGDKRRQRQAAGFTIPMFAHHFNLPVSQVRLAVRNGEIKAVEFAGRRRIPPAEAERVKQLFGLTPRDDSESGE